MDPFDDLYARVIVEHALAVRSGQSVLIEAGEAAEPLVRAVHRRVLEAGGQPAVQMLPDGWIEAKAECAAEEVLAEADPLKLTWYERVDCRVTLLALANVEQLAHVDPARAAASETGRLRAVHVLVDRDARGEAVWCGAQYPTAAFAQAAGLSLDGYRELLARALKLDQPDPVVAWRAQGELQDRLVERLRGGRRAARRGRGHRPAAARRRPPLDQRLRPPQPARRRGLHGPARGRDRGRRDVRDALGLGRTARRGRAPALRGRALRRGRGRERRRRSCAPRSTPTRARARSGEFAFGLNEAIRAPTLDTLLDEKIGGTVHMALGSSYAVTGGTNTSALHWDLVCDLRDGGEVYADGTLIQRDGRFLGDFA